MSRSARWFMVLGCALIAFAVLYIAFGDMRIRIDHVVKALLGRGLAEEILVVRELRAPRLVVAVLTGASLAVAGAILQCVFRNPLAAPDLIGITGGAAAAAASFLTFRSAAVSIHWLPAAAMCGAGVVSMLIYLFAWKKGVAPSRLILVGIGIGALTGAYTNALLVFGDQYTAADAYVWLTGTIYASSWKHVLMLAPWTIGFLLLAIYHGKNMNVLALTDDSAISVGNAVGRSRFILIAISVGLAGSAVAIGGVIGFVGLIGPHIARRLVGPGARRLIPMAAICGSLIVVAADLVARTAFLPYDLPVGVFTAGVGAPFFIYLLYRGRRR